MRIPCNYNDLSSAKKKMVRDTYVKVQNGLCHHCDKPLTGGPSSSIMLSRINKNLFPKGFFNYPVHLHHCHRTGMTIGAVHARCNAYLWEFEYE